MPSRSAGTWLWPAIGLACAMQLFEVWHRGIDPDELEHLHAGYCVSRGMLPYRDFFEHHGPLLYYAQQPLFALRGAELDVLWLARLAMWLCSLATLAVTAGVARRLAGPTAGLIAMTLLAWSSVFHRKGIELRPDVPAMLLVTIAFWLSLPARSDRFSWRRTLAIGLLSGAATLFTQKSIVPVAGLTLALAARELVDRDLRRAALAVALIGAGGLVAWGAAAGMFARHGAARDFLDSTVVRLVVWPIECRKWDYLRPTLIAEFTLWFAGAAETVAALRSWRSRAVWETGLGQTAFAAGFSIVGLLWVKATYTQYYVLWFPLLAALAARRLATWAGLAPPRGGWLAARCLGTLLIAAAVGLALRDVSLQAAGSLPHLARFVPAWRAYAFATSLLIAFAACAACLALWFGRGSWRAVVALLAVAGMFQAVLRNVDSHAWPNRGHVAAIRAVQATAGPEETVLDGFTGYGALRDHAYYYWWINEYSLALMTPDERGPKLLAALQSAPPAVVLLDAELERVPAEVLNWIHENYQPGEPAPLWVRRPPPGNSAGPD